VSDAIDAFSTLDDFLLSLADGISLAQSELTRAASGEDGAQFVYHLPRVDFELKLSVRAVHDDTLSGRYRQHRPTRIGDTHLVFKPILVGDSTTTIDIGAVVKGSFVSVPANNGLPTPVITTVVDAEDPARVQLAVTVRNTAGEPLPAAEVQLNVDREESVALSAAAGISTTVDDATRFEHAAVVTDADGRASATLVVADGQSAALLVLVLDVAGRTEKLVYEVTA
jgi:hypothetical protein